MGRLCSLAGVAILWSGVASAQQPSANPLADTYRQLFIEASDRVAALVAQVSALQAHVSALTKQLEDAKKSGEAKP